MEEGKVKVESTKCTHLKPAVLVGARGRLAQGVLMRDENKQVESLYYCSWEI
jgi:hypothetical protein